MGAIDDQIFYRLADSPHILRVLVRLLVAAVLGGCIGIEREKEQKTAGMRTHMLVSLGTALFVSLSLEAGIELKDLSRVIQGLTTGIGFLGAGAILKLQEKAVVRGLTTAAGLWVTAAVGTAMGFGLFWPALLGVLLALFIMMYLQRFESWIDRYRGRSDSNPPAQPNDHPHQR